MEGTGNAVGMDTPTPAPMEAPVGYRLLSILVRQSDYTYTVAGALDQQFVVVMLINLPTMTWQVLESFF